MPTNLLLKEVELPEQEEELLEDGRFDIIGTTCMQLIFNKSALIRRL